MIRLPLSLAAGALMLAAGTALAQTSDDDTAVDAVRSPMELTCGELAEMNEEDVHNLLYYAAGYAARDAMEAGSADASTTAEASVGAAGTAPATPLATTGSENTEGATSATGGDSAAATETTADAPISGLDIDVEQVLAACGDAPEARLSDVLKQQPASED